MAGLTETDKIYLAGYFDADGCIFVNVSKDVCVSIGVSIGGRNKPLLEELELAYGGTFVSTMRKRPQLNSGQLYSRWVWILTGRKVAPFLRDVLPYLRLKKRRGKLALELAEMTRDRPGSRPVPRRIIAWRAKLALEICELNQAGLSNPKETLTMKKLQKLAGKYHRD